MEPFCPPSIPRGVSVTDERFEEVSLFLRLGRWRDTCGLDRGWGLPLRCWRLLISVHGPCTRSEDGLEVPALVGDEDMDLAISVEVITHRAQLRRTPLGQIAHRHRDRRGQQ